MALFIFLICAFTVIVNANWQSDYGPFKNVLYSKWITCDHSKKLDQDVSETELYFYDFQNDFNVSYKINNAVDSITRYYNLDVTRQIKFFVPGYKSHINRNAPELIRQSFKQIPNVYLIIIDHSIYTSSREGNRKSYERSVFYSYYIAKALAKVLADFKNVGFPSQNIHCIGHSLGSQILGYAGFIYFDLTAEKVWRITGIDPAGPCFSNSLIEEQLRSGAADYVEVFHCNAGGLGTTSVLADIDFFLNDGKVQPHCHVGIIPGYGESDAARCSHKACVRYWTYSIKNPGSFLAWRCDSYRDFASGKCAGNEVAIAGYTNPGNTSGVFYASTETYGVL
ncbi:pancreatic triacylglycerol lipase-like [Colias croceus]|uniref:pancreatic triacylglycerol lipase-like n=1 Tax=Colias crocea TaxID=72248 RepID=UPI001E27CD1E|nr:pancreatic triacylglycerol lipase-like [Colias croceus]